MSKKKSQKEIKEELVLKIYECINTISKRDEISDEALIMHLAEIRFNGKLFDMAITLTPPGVLDAFNIFQMDIKDSKFN